MFVLTKNLLIFISLIVINYSTFLRGEVFTAISDVEPLLETHERIIKDLDDYIIREEKRLSILKRHLKIYIREHQKAMDDIPNYLGNPINAYTLIKRMTTDLEFIKWAIDMGTEHINDITIMDDAETKYPTSEDLTGAALALTRLQETYHLKVNDLAEGRLNGIIYRDDVMRDTDNGTIAVSSKMSASDSYELGKILYDEKDFTNALAWMMVALNKFKEENYVHTFEETDILEYISFSHHYLGNFRQALTWSKKILEIDPSHSRALESTANFQKIVTDEDEKIRQNNGNDETIVEKKEESEPFNQYDQVRKEYEALCRGEKEVPTEISKQLKCSYLTRNSFLKLAPIKMEYKYRNPDIVLFHEVLSNDEIEHIKELAKPRFQRATVRDSKTDTMLPVKYRISKSAWLDDGESSQVARVSQRIADFTGLDMGTAEQLQVANYGIGGHYEPHFDFARTYEAGFGELIGNRIATVLFYMSDVVQGGATVFTELGLSLFPVRGAAAMWFNLHASGEGDLATKHAACPVLRGSKWVCNKWIHQVGQEFVKPCDLEYQKEELRPLPQPVSKILK